MHGILPVFFKTHRSFFGRGSNGRSSIFWDHQQFGTQCEGGTRLFVRYLDNGAAAWVILPEREFRLNKATSTSGTRYSNGSATLDLKDGAATLSDGATVTHAGCKASGG